MHHILEEEESKEDDEIEFETEEGILRIEDDSNSEVLYKDDALINEDEDSNNILEVDYKIEFENEEDIMGFEEDMLAEEPIESDVVEPVPEVEATVDYEENIATSLRSLVTAHTAESVEDTAESSDLNNTEELNLDKKVDEEIILTEKIEVMVPKKDGLFKRLKKCFFSHQSA